MVRELLYSRISQMEPLLPQAGDAGLHELAVAAIRQSAALGAALHPVTRRAVVEMVRSMNSYYSNLIEGHNTHPLDIEKALARDFSDDPVRRAMQMESVAHVEVERLIEEQLRRDPEIDICSARFLCWIHREFFVRLPEEFRMVRLPDGKMMPVAAGELRQSEVVVGRHLAPAAAVLPDFLSRFADIYGNPGLPDGQRIVAAAASHHRLAWIHPFLDGNGRVTRLFTHAFLVKARIDGQGLWTVSRGLARNRSAYLAALAMADELRQGDLDGRGSLTDRGLVAFCQFFLKTALDQIDFMTGLLDLDGMMKRIAGYAGQQASLGHLQPEAGYLLREVFLRGEVARGEAARITGRPERTARRILKETLEYGLLTGDSEKGPVRLRFPAKVVGYYFPGLYPEGMS